MRELGELERISVIRRSYKDPLNYSMFLLCCVFCLILLIVAKHIYFEKSKKASRKDSEEGSRTEEIENGGGIRLHPINFLYLFFSLFIFLSKVFNYS